MGRRLPNPPLQPIVPDPRNRGRHDVWYVHADLCVDCSAQYIVVPKSSDYHVISTGARPAKSMLSSPTARIAHSRSFFLFPCSVRSFPCSFLPSDHLSFSGSSDSKKTLSKVSSPPLSLPQRFIFWLFFRCHRAIVEEVPSPVPDPKPLLLCLSFPHSFPFQDHWLLGFVKRK